MNLTLDGFSLAHLRPRKKRVQDVACDANVTAGLVDVEQFAEIRRVSVPALRYFGLIASEDDGEMIAFVCGEEPLARIGSVEERPPTDFAEMVVVSSVVCKIVPYAPSDILGDALFAYVAQMCSLRRERVGLLASAAVRRVAAGEYKRTAAFRAFLRVFCIVLAHKPLAKRDARLAAEFSSFM